MRKSETMYLLKNVVQAYAWGSRRSIAQLCGRDSPSEGPEAEMWMGGHRSAPSVALVDGTPRSLLELVDESPEAFLGKCTLDRFGARLPFLMKVLAAQAPLSIQVHPSSSQAQEGYTRENAAGVDIDSKQRNYKDPYHKPELIYALERFEALCGFRSDDAIFARQDILGEALAKRVVGSRREALSYLLRLQGAERAEVLAACLARCERRSGNDSLGRDCAWATRLAALYPSDIGVIVSLILNRIELEVDEAIFLPAGVLHAYLQGFGVEIMACSDNVLRGGLTPKHIDIDELLTITDFSPYYPSKLAPRMRGQEAVYQTDASEFQLSRLDVSGLLRLAPVGVEILLCIAGEVTAKSGEHEIRMRGGDSVVVKASDDSYLLYGNGRIFRACVPSA